MSGYAEAKSMYADKAYNNQTTTAIAKRSAETAMDDLSKRISYLASIADRAESLADRACGTHPRGESAGKDAPTPPGFIFRLGETAQHLGFVADRIEAAISRLESFI